MAIVTLTPSSETSAVTLPATGTLSKAQTASNYPFGIYGDSTAELYDANFVSGAVEQVSYTYRKLGGDVLDIEVTEQNVFAAYEEAVLEYSYIINIHQAKNTLPNVLGNTTGTFDHHGQQLSSSPMSGTEASLRLPRFTFGYADRVGDGVGNQIGLGGNQNTYSASFNTVQDIQDYDLQSLINASSSQDETVPYYGKVGGKRVNIKRVFYKTPHAMWRFYGYYGGLNTVGNMSTYGMYSDDSSWEIIPPWQNKAQAMAYEDAIYTRNSHYSYEIKNNNLRIFPKPTTVSPSTVWVEFTIQEDAWDEETDRSSGHDGVNNMNTLPFANLPYKNINSIGKQWIRRFALALTKEMLGQVRGKFGSIPIPGNDLQLNASDLLNQSKDEQDKLREELKTILDELTYSKLTEIQSSIVQAAQQTLATVPVGMLVG